MNEFQLDLHGIAHDVASLWGGEVWTEPWAWAWAWGGTQGKGRADGERKGGGVRDSMDATKPGSRDTPNLVT